jgi:hypothetical protein
MILSNHLHTVSDTPLSNDLARLLRLPLLLSRSMNINYPKVFQKKLSSAASITASIAKDALLIIAIDAADNSVLAAQSQTPVERSFVHDFVSIGTLPSNVRLIVTSRSGKLSSLNLPPTYSLLEIANFIHIETSTHVSGSWDAPSTWIDDFHHLSRGNPRVQRYALDYSEEIPAQALEYLRPNGKGLSQIFLEQFEFARIKGGNKQNTKAFCAGLVALPRPVPIEHLSSVTGIRQASIRDLCADLSPGIRLENGVISFTDEDFEHFVRSEAKERLSEFRSKTAENFLTQHKTDGYAATHVADALFLAGRGSEVIELINKESVPESISDPILRRQVQLKRLKIAMKVSRESGDNVDAMLTLLIGAEALKTDAVIRKMIVENPDLAASFARDTSSRDILRDPTAIEHHGPLLFHLMSTDAHKKNSISVREGHRLVHAWMQRRKREFEEQEKKHPNASHQGWDISIRDIMAETEAILRTTNPREALNFLLRWRPKNIAAQVALNLSSNLIISGENNLVKQCLDEVGGSPWNIFLLVPLALAGDDVDLSQIETSLVRMLRRGLISPELLRDVRSDKNVSAEMLDVIVTACEIIISRGGDAERIIPILSQIAGQDVRRSDKLYDSQISLLDITLRAFALLERLAGRKISSESYFVKPPEPPSDMLAQDVKRRKRQNSERKEEIKKFITPFLAIYDIRVQILLGLIPSNKIETQIDEALKSLKDNDYQLSRTPYGNAMRKQVALSISKLIGEMSVDSSMIFSCISKLVKEKIAPLNSSITEIYKSLALDVSLHLKILAEITARANTVVAIKSSAEEKIEALIDYARMLLLISPKDAESLFSEAIMIAGDVNYEAIHELSLFGPLARRAVESMETEQRREISSNILVIASDAAVRLEGYDHFPWDKTAQALATLDICMALAAVARWEDTGIITQSTLLPPVLATAISSQEMHPNQTYAFSSLLDWFSEEQTLQIIEKAREQRANTNFKDLTEDIAKEELLRFSNGTSQKVVDKLKLLINEKEFGFWLEQLDKTVVFHEAKLQKQENSLEQNNFGAKAKRVKQDDLLEQVDWKSHQFISAEEITDAIKGIRKKPDTYTPVSKILDRIGNSVALKDAVSYLDAICLLDSSLILGEDLIRAIIRHIDNWHESMAVKQWGREKLLQVVVKQLPRLSRHLAYNQSLLPALLEKSEATDEQIFKALLEAIEYHSDQFDAPTIYALVGLAGQYCTSEDAATLLSRYSKRLVQRVPQAEREIWDLTEIPYNLTGSIARFLYALMGDIDIRVRWRAAHTLRRLVRLGNINILQEIINLYPRVLEPSYRNPDAPFYWLSARLWLIMTLDRIAIEVPERMKDYGVWLLEVAIDKKFPHVLIRSFAKSAVAKLLASGSLKLSASEEEMLKQANISNLQRVKTKEPRYSIGFERYRDSNNINRKFHFNSMDTLPYWYSGALRIFANIPAEEFLDAAERWIVDCWGVHNNPWRWDDEPRKYRISDHLSLFTSHRHGSLPSVERYHTHLEWHAMWCSIGELMNNHPLANDDEDDYYDYENLLKNNSLSSPPFWLVDFHGTKPLEKHLWIAPPKKIETWVDDITDDDFLIELGLLNESIVVDSSHTTRSHNFSSSIRVHSALVSPSTASSLVRALQSIEDSWNYELPYSNEEIEINKLPFRLVGWLNRNESDTGIDETDSLRYEVSKITSQPSKRVIETLNLTFAFDNQIKWIDTDNGSTVFLYKAWGDSRGDEQESSLRYDQSVRSSGQRLLVNKQALLKYLNSIEMDLIIEIEITRRNKGYGVSRYDEEKTKESRFDRVLVIRRDGSIEAAEGCIGTWTTPST